MKQIGFKNFRRFQDLPSLDIAPITIFVGENNAGKSTVVKGILALSDFLNRWRNEDFDFYLEKREGKSSKEIKEILYNRLKNQKFYFNTSYLAHIGTFKRALYNKANDGIITFYFSLGSLDITIEVSGDRDDEESVSGIISKVKVSYTFTGLSVIFDLQADVADVEYAPLTKEQIEKAPSYIKRKNKIIAFSNKHTEIIKFSFKISDYYEIFAPNLIAALNDSFVLAINATLDIDKAKESYDMELFGNLNPISSIGDKSKQFLKLYSEEVCGRSTSSRGEQPLFELPCTRMPLRMFNIEYLYAHAVTQTVIYSAKDTNDYLSRTIHEFASIPKIDDDYRRSFIKHWMKEFGIGKDYLITSVGGEAHIVKIQNDDDERVNLSDKGMGSIQLMVLLFRLAITLPKQIHSKKESNINRGFQRSRIIIIEEPEQNLHPMLQSKLAELLFRLNQDYGYCFIIETHSEYLIRKTQVIVKGIFTDLSRSLSENPFKVYYFNSASSEKPYYEIVYQRDGSFSNDFGKGFFDEASNLAFEIL